MISKTDFTAATTVRGRAYGVLVLLGLRKSQYDDLLNFVTFFVGFIVAYGGVGSIQLEPSMWPGFSIALVGVLIMSYRNLVRWYLTRR